MILGRDARLPAADRPLRVVLQQPALPEYRLPVFEALAKRPDIELHVSYGDAAGLMPPRAGHPPFDGEFTPVRRLAGPACWHRPQWRCARRTEADVIVLAWDLHYVSLLPAMLRARAQGLGVVLWGHGYSKNEKTLRQAIRQNVGSLASALLFYNHRVAQAHAEAGFDPRKLFVAPNALDQRPIQEARRRWLDQPQRLEEFRKEQGLAKGPVMLFCSRLAPQRRIDLAIEALPRLTRRWPNLQLVLIGDGDDERQRLQGIARSLGVEPNVRFTGPIHGQDNLAPWFLCAQLMCFPSHIGLSLLHAMGYGLPVVTSDSAHDHGPEFDALRHGHNGLLYKRGDAASLAAALEKLLADETLRRQLGDEARRTAIEDYGIDAMVAGMERAIRAAGGRPAEPESPPPYRGAYLEARP